VIRHRPTGSGHPYTPDTDQRTPTVPVEGGMVTIGARASADIVAVELEVHRTAPDGTTSTRTIALERAARTERGQVVDGGHLASAQAKLARAHAGWRAEVDAGERGTRLRYRFAGRAADGGTQTTRWFETAVAGWRDAPVEQVLAPVGVDRVLPATVRVLDDGVRVHRVAFGVALQPGEHVTGFGERYDALDHRGSELDAMVFEQYKSQGEHRRTYLPMPFAHVVGGTGWGFHVRTMRRVRFDVGRTDAAVLGVEVDVDPRAGSELPVEVAFYDGPPVSVLDAFLADTGRPSELPDWVLRLWASGNEWNTQAEVMRQMDLHAEHGIPVGSVVIEAWSDESTFTAFRDARYTPAADGGPLRLADYEFPPDGAWPDPRGMVDELHRRGTRVHLWQIPLIKMRPHPVGQARADADAAVREGHLIREETPDGGSRPYRNRGWWFPLALMPDLADPRAAAWWTSKRRYLVDEIGIDGFKTDGGEHAWGDDLLHLDGTRGAAGNNRFPVAYAQAYGDLLRSCGRAPVTFSRAGHVGSAAHGAFWAGDENSTWDAFRWSVLAGLSAAASGIVYWGWDIAGFSGDIPDAELYLRAMSASVFMPIMQYHSEFNHHRRPSRDRTPWNIADRTGDERVLPAVRRFVRARESLVPYLAEQASTAVSRSRPMMRPLYFDQPDDERVWSYPLQWLVGDDLLVTPVVEPGAGDLAVLLPEGRWSDPVSGETLEGGTETRRVVPADALPVLVREGSPLAALLV